MSDENTKVIDEKAAENGNEKQEIILINKETIQNKIHIIRGERCV